MGGADIAGGGATVAGGGWTDMTENLGRTAGPGKRLGALGESVLFRVSKTKTMSDDLAATLLGFNARSGHANRTSVCAPMMSANVQYLGADRWFMHISRINVD